MKYNCTLFSKLCQSLGGYSGDIISANDYYAFGAPMPERTFSSASYKYGFNGKEKTDEINGDGAVYDYGFRIYEARLGRFLSVDPLFQSYPWYTPYQFAGNKPIASIDLDGLEDKPVNNNTSPTEPNATHSTNYSGKGFCGPLSEKQEALKPLPLKPLPLLPANNSVANFKSVAKNKESEKKNVKDLSVTTNGKAFIKSFEKGPDGGAALTIYDDANPTATYKTGDASTGTLTIGWGHAILASEDYSNGITETEAETLFESDLKTKAIDPILRNVTAQLTQQQFDALVIYVFNTGSLSGTNLLKNINDEDFDAAVKEMDINKGNGVFMQGLENRRVKERNIFKDGKYVNN